MSLRGSQTPNTVMLTLLWVVLHTSCAVIVDVVVLGRTQNPQSAGRGAEYERVDGSLPGNYKIWFRRASLR